MAALSTTLALIGLAAGIGAWAGKPNAARTPGTSTRSRGTAPITGRAVPRATVSGETIEPLTAPQAPPSTTAAASAAYATAQGVREKQRKRAAAGGSVLSAAYAGKTGPRAVLQPRMLIGG